MMTTIWAGFWSTRDRAVRRWLYGISGAAAGITVSLWGQVALAACTPGAQCVVNDGSLRTVADETFVAAASGPFNAALVATGTNSTIVGERLTLNAQPSLGFMAAFAGSNSTIVLEDSSVTGWYGLRADGFGSVISMENGTINAQDRAVHLLNSGAISLTNVVIQSSSKEYGVDVGYSLGGTGGNSFFMTGGSITNDTSAALSYSNSSAVTLTDVDISGRGAWSIYGSSGGLYNYFSMTGGTVNHVGNPGSETAVQLGHGDAELDGVRIISNTGGIRSMSDTGPVNLDMKNFVIEAGNKSFGDGIEANKNSRVRLEDGSIKTLGDTAHGIWYSENQSNPLLDLDRVKIETFGASAMGVLSQTGHGTLDDVDIAVHGSGAYGLYHNPNSSADPSSIVMTGGSIAADGNGAGGVYAVNQGNVALDGVKVTTRAGYGVMLVYNSDATIRNGSSIHTEGAAGYGLVFIDTTPPNTNSMTVEGSTVQAKDAVAVLAQGGVDTVNVWNGSTIRGDFLASAQSRIVSGTAYGSHVIFNAQDSQLFGHTRITEPAPGLTANRLTMNLGANSVWTLQPSVVTLTAQGSPMQRSDVSFLNIDGGAVVFDSAVGTPDWAQTLVVGSGYTAGNTAVYNAGAGGASITLNTRLNPGGALADQQTDRLLINGDVSGTTLITVKEVAGSPGGLTSPTGANLASEGISLVQASGAAQESSFALAGGYVAMGGLPYRYDLYAYGPGSSRGDADASQKLVDVGGTNPHWDWRLQNALIPDKPDETPPGGTPDPGEPINPGEPADPVPNPDEPPVLAVVPQVPSYLAAPNALFVAGLQDLGNLHLRLGELRGLLGSTITMDQASAADTVASSRVREFGSAFVRAYGGDLRYQTHLQARQYGSDVSMDYAGMQGGGSLYVRNTPTNRLRFGLAGSYGRMSFEPRGVADTSKTRMDTWMLAPFMTWQNDAGVYVDAILAYGGFSGDVSTRLRGKTSTLKGDNFGASLETGVAIPVAGLTVEPQLQLVYQRLKFDRTQDVDGFPVDLGTLEQWKLRAGGKVQKTFYTAAGSRIRLYGNLNVMHGLGNAQSVWLGSSFLVGKPGTTLETGLGASLTLADANTAVYASVARQQRIGSAGLDGWTFNLGGKFRF